MSLVAIIAARLIKPSVPVTAHTRSEYIFSFDRIPKEIPFTSYRFFCRILEESPDLNARLAIITLDLKEGLAPSVMKKSEETFGIPLSESWELDGRNTVFGTSGCFVANTPYCALFERYVEQDTICISVFHVQEPGNPLASLFFIPKRPSE